MPLVNVPAGVAGDSPRFAPRMRVRVWLRDDNRHNLCGQSVVAGPDGTATLVVYQDEKPALERAVETETEKVKMAESAHAAEVATFVAKHCEITPEEVGATPESRWTAEMKAAARRCPSSVQRHFRLMALRPIRILTKWEKIEDIDPPTSAEQQYAALLADKQGERMAQAMAEALRLLKSESDAPQQPQQGRRRRRNGQSED